MAGDQRAAELERWFPAAADWTPATGETFEAYGATGEVTEVDAPHRLAWTFGGERYSFELTAQEGGCRLVFTDVFDDRRRAAQTAAGWEAYLSRLEPHLAGGYLSEEQAHEPWEEVHERYAERFGVDPEPAVVALSVLQCRELRAIAAVSDTDLIVGSPPLGRRVRMKLVRVRPWATSARHAPASSGARRAVFSDSACSAASASTQCDCSPRRRRTGRRCGRRTTSCASTRIRTYVHLG